MGSTLFLLDLGSTVTQMARPVAVYTQDRFERDTQGGRVCLRTGAGAIGFVSRHSYTGQGGALLK